MHIHRACMVAACRRRCERAYAAIPSICTHLQVLGLPAALSHLGWAGGVIFLVFSIWVSW